jgi:predicted XRE-type DNA-binding protein
MHIDTVLKTLDVTQSELAEMLGITRQSVSDWRHKSCGMVPEKQMYKLRLITRNKIKVNPKDYMD